MKKSPTIEKLIEKGYYWTNPDITSANFPVPEKIETEGYKFIPLEKYTSSEECLEIIKQAGYRPANIYEIALLKENHPEAFIKGKWYIAFGSTWKDADGRVGVPFVNARTDGDFEFRLGYWGGDWVSGYVLVAFATSPLETTTLSVREHLDSLTLEIPLTQGKVAIVDKEDYAELSKMKWAYSKSLNTGYARSYVNENGKKKYIYMHNLIMKTPKGMDTDHINRNGLDNRKENLRIATRSENNRNASLRKDNTSGIKGVSFNRNTKKWEVQKKINGRNYHFGSFSEKEIAIEVNNNIQPLDASTLKEELSSLDSSTLTNEQAISLLKEQSFKITRLETKEVEY